MEIDRLDVGPDGRKEAGGGGKRSGIVREGSGEKTGAKDEIKYWERGQRSGARAGASPR